MPDEADKFLSLAAQMRARAEEILSRAENFQDADARARMRRVAESYQRLAERLEMAAGK